ncbi:MAG: pyrimidine dimer DNA glycosylase/endonuclease V [Candidatus Omnitrophota bacterium]
MRLWSIHPRHLDCQGLLALWREALLAQKVLLKKTKGYTHHSQLERFKKHPDPVSAIGFYLAHIYKESRRRGYDFRKEKIVSFSRRVKPIKVSRGQICFECAHLSRKLKIRDKNKNKELIKAKRTSVHPLFLEVAGPRESWEKTKGIL